MNSVFLRYGLLFLALFPAFAGSAQTTMERARPDSLGMVGEQGDKYEERSDRYALFYDSLRAKAQSRRLTRMLYRVLVPGPRKPEAPATRPFMPLPRREDHWQNRHHQAGGVRAQHQGHLPQGDTLV